MQYQSVISVYKKTDVMKRVAALLLLLPLVFCSCEKDEQRIEIWIIASERGVARGLTEFQPAYIIKKEGSASWRTFSGEIEGFTFEQGYESTLTVLIEPLSTPPMDGPSQRCTLQEVLSRLPIQSLEIDEYSPKLDMTVASHTGIFFGKPCYWIKPASGDQASWHPFLHEIHGLEHLAGYEYTLRIRVSTQYDELEMRPRVSYEQIEELSREQKTSEDMPVNTP